MNTPPAGFRVQIISGQVYIAGEVIDWHNTQSRNRNVKLQLLDVAQHYRLPDVDFLLLTGDWPPEDRSGQSTGCPLQGPVFMQVSLPCQQQSHVDWTDADILEMSSLDKCCMLGAAC